MNNTFLSDFCTTYQIPKIQEKLNTLYPNFDQKIPYTWIKMARDTVYPKPLAGPDKWEFEFWYSGLKGQVPRGTGINFSSQPQC